MKDDRPLIIITARIGSSRLQGKVLKPFWKEYSILEFLIRRLQTSPVTSRIKLAIPDTSENEPVALIGLKCGVEVLRGPEDDVLERMNLCLKGEDTQFVSRVTADNPLTDTELFTSQWEEMKMIVADYSYCRDCPKGLAADIWTLECFKKSVANASTPYEHEHANAWVWNNLRENRILWYKSTGMYKNIDGDFSIDTQADYESMKKLVSNCTDPIRSSLRDLVSVNSRL